MTRHKNDRNGRKGGNYTILTAFRGGNLALKGGSTTIWPAFCGRKFTTKSFFPGKNCYIAIFPRVKLNQPAPRKTKDIGSAPAIDIQLLSLCFDKSNFPDVGLPFLNLNIVMKKYNILV